MTNNLESVRVLWSATDEQFFRIAAELFPPKFLQGATVLLTSYDPEPAAQDDAPTPTASLPAPAASGVNV